MLGQDLMEEEVQEFFEPSNNKNQYQYCFNDNVALINHNEEIWMITHQWTQVPFTHALLTRLKLGPLCVKGRGDK
jgi:hypothetical protein